MGEDGEPKLSNKEWEVGRAMGGAQINGGWAEIKSESGGDGYWARICLIRSGDQMLIKHVLQLAVLLRQNSEQKQESGIEPSVQLRIHTEQRLDATLDRTIEGSRIKLSAEDSGLELQSGLELELQSQPGY